MISRQSGWQRADTTLAILAGARHWRDGRASSADLAAAAVQIASLLSLLTIAVMSLTHSPGDVTRLWPDWLVLTVLLGTGGALGLPCVLLMAGREASSPTHVPGGIRTIALARASTLTAFLVAWVVAMRGISLPSAWLFGALGGAEAAMTLWAMGFPLEPRTIWPRFMASSVHVGVVLGLAVASAFSLDHGRWRTVAAMYLSVHIAVLTAAVVIQMFDIICRYTREAAHDAIDRDRARNARDRAHWLHDDVCSELRLVQARLETGRIEPHEVANALRELDDQLRVRQLDEILHSGTVRLAEVIQPYVRRAQNAGTVVTDVPRFEEAALILDARVGRIVQRGTAIFVTNAVQAGATHLAIRIRVDESPRQLVLEVEDDGGGFDLHTTHPGRGIDNLRHELGDDTVSFERTPTGTRAVLVIRDSKEGAHDPAPAA